MKRLDTIYEQAKTRETVSTQFMHDQWKRRTSIQLAPECSEWMSTASTYEIEKC